MNVPEQSAMRRCRECGAPLSTNARGGLCLRCALDHALEASASGDTAVAASHELATRQPSPGPRAVRYFGDYELQEEIGRGGMGVVYKARQVSLHRFVAVKMLLSGELASKEFVQRFRTEASAAALLQHPNIVAIHEVGVHDGQHYFSMDYVEGPSLGKLVAHQPLSAKRAAGYVKTIAEAIHYAHERGILHRDLKPSNVLIDPFDQPRVTDFGLAKRFGVPPSGGAGAPEPAAAGSPSDLTITGQVLGSPNYMPPEQAAAKRGKVGKPSDVYSLGAILYHLLTGRPPFVGESLTDTLHQVLNAEPVSPRLLIPSVPRDLETICLKCLEKEPGKRYATAQALAHELNRFLNDEPIQARPVSTPEKFWRWCRRKPVVASLGAALMLVFLAGILGVVSQLQRARRGETTARRNLYASDLKLAAQAWELGEIGHARSLLAAHRPEPNQEDLRGFEWRLLSALCRPDESVVLPVETSVWYAIALSPNGRLVVTGGRNGRLLVWDLPKREVTGQFLGHDLHIGCLAFSPDGRTLASGSGGAFAPNQPGELKLWDVESRTLITNLTGHSLCLNDLAFSHDGKFLATAGADKTILVWDVATKRIAARLEDHADEVLKLAFSPNRLLLATASRDHTAKLWEVPSGRCVKTFKGHTLKLWSVAFSADGTKLVTGSADATAMIWDVASGELVANFPQRAEVESVAFSPDGNTLAVGSFGSVTLYDLQIQEPTLSFKGLAGGVRWLAFVPDGQTLLSSVEFGMPKLWNIASAPKMRVERPHADATMALAVSHNSKLVATGSGDFFQRHRPSEIKLWDFPSGRLLQTLTNHQADVMWLAFTPDDRLLASGSIDKTVRLWDVASGKQAHLFTQGLGEVWTVAISADGQALASGTGDARVQLWDIPSRKALPALVHSGEVDHVAFAPLGSVLASGSRDGTVRIWDPKTGDVKQRLKHNPMIASLAFSPDGKALAAGSTDKSIKLWDVESGHQTGLFEGHQHVVTILAFSPDGKILASGSVDSTVKLWNLAIRQEVATLRGHRDGIFALAFTPDGNTLISGSRDKTLRFWRAQPVEGIEAKEKGAHIGR